MEDFHPHEFYILTEWRPTVIGDCGHVNFLKNVEDIQESLVNGDSRVQYLDKKSKDEDAQAGQAKKLNDNIGSQEAGSRAHQESASHHHRNSGVSISPYVPLCVLRYCVYNSLVANIPKKTTVTTGAPGPVLPPAGGIPYTV